MNELENKLDNLKSYIKSLDSLAIAFSGGVDSTFLLKVAHDVLGEKAVAVTARSATFPQRELDEATAFAAASGIRHLICVSEELDIEGFASNPINRCYLCKKELFAKIKTIAADNNLRNIAEGSNMDDNGDYRPGLLAVAEFGIVSPLRHAKLNKSEIRQLSKEMGLPTWKKPSFACLSSRIPYGESITVDKLAMIDKGEQLLFDLGFYQVRIRHHGNLARIEIDDRDFERIMNKETRDLIQLKLKELGYAYITLDLKGYRTGSMNETLDI